MDKEVQDWLDEQANEFMVPDIQYLMAGEFDSPDSEEVEPTESGWYSRLSAPGYMDCTDWSGPYDSEEEAAVGLYEMFAE